MTITIRIKVVFRKGDGCLKHVIALESLRVDYSSVEVQGTYTVCVRFTCKWL